MDKRIGHNDPENLAIGFNQLLPFRNSARILYYIL
jgi:hypothetical protein